MRTSVLPSFRKLYGVITQDIPAGKYYIRIMNNYDMTSFGGHKHFVVSTTNLLGGSNYFLAICYISIGTICFIFGIVFFVGFLNRKAISKIQAVNNL